MQTRVSFELGTLVSYTLLRNREVVMNNIIYIVGAVVIVLVILSFVGIV